MGMGIILIRRMRNLNGGAGLFNLYNFLSPRSVLKFYYKSNVLYGDFKKLQVILNQFVMCLSKSKSK